MSNPDKSSEDIKTVSKYFRKYKRYLIFGGIAILFTNLFILYTPYLTKEIFDLLESKAPMSEILETVMLMVVLTAIAGFFRFLMRRTIIWMSRHIEYDLRGDLMAHLLKMSPSFYHENRTGDIMARMTNDLEAVRQMVGPGVMYISDSLLKLIISFSVMFFLSPTITFYALAPLLVLPIAVNLVANVLHVRSMKVQEHFSLITSTTQENLSGIRVIKAYRQEENEIDNFNLLSNKYIKLNMALAKLHGLFMPMMRLIASLSYLSVFYFGGLKVIDGTISLGTLVAFFAYLSVILWPVIALGWVLSLYQRGRASLIRINKIFASQPDIKENKKNPHREKLKGKIEFRNLSFAYNGSNILDNLNLTINPGETLGIIGLTGSGKTTIVSLLPKLFPVADGQLFIDDIDINDWETASLRSQIGFTTQETFLFSNSIKNNILFGVKSADISDEEINSAAEIASLDKDVESFPNKYETIVGERGITLSGGQKQRTAIARSIIIDPAILILDDATSAVDTETEHEINERIKQVLKNRTSIIISHRISAVKDADIIINIQGGKILEQGDHDSLIKLGGAYASLYQTQLLAMELESL